MMRIGIAVDPAAAQLCSANNAWQCAFFLARALAGLPQVTEVLLFSTDAAAVTPAVMGASDFRWMTLEVVGDHVDVIIDVGGTCEVSWLRLQRARSKKVVLYKIKQPFAERVEPAVFDRPSRTRSATRFDEVWMPPAFAAFVSFERVISRCPVFVVPYLWDASFVKDRITALAVANRPFGWTRAARKEGWCVAIFESNRSVSSSANIPLLVCDEAARAQPGSVWRMTVVNSLHLVEHPTMMFLANSLDLVRQHRALFVGDFDLIDIMPGQADAVVSHQWHNSHSSLNLEALWGGYPLVHNSPWLLEFGLGYYYPGFDAAEGGRRLRCAVAQHGDTADQDQLRAQVLFETVDPGNVANRQALGHRLTHLQGDRVRRRLA